MVSIHQSQLNVDKDGLWVGVGSQGFNELLGCQVAKRAVRSDLIVVSEPDRCCVACVG
jgi:hypothetical protein